MNNKKNSKNKFQFEKVDFNAIQTKPWRKNIIIFKIKIFDLKFKEFCLLNTYSFKCE